MQLLTKELEGINKDRGVLGLGIERDLYFKPCTIKDIELRGRHLRLVKL